MGDKTGIEWADATWNPVTGCDKVSPGCDRCYAETFAERWRGTKGHYFETGFDLLLRPDKLDLPLRWNKPRKVFVNSMSDLFHDKVPDEYIARVFAVMALAPQHTFQVLTKRHGRMRALLKSRAFLQLVWEAWSVEEGPGESESLGTDPAEHWPLPNVWLGVSAEDQQRADLRIPALLDTPAAVRFISAEPLLGPTMFLLRWLHRQGYDRRIDWVIAGGESGPGARPMHPDWVRTLRDQCVATGTAFLFKQWGEWAPAPELPGMGSAIHVFDDGVHVQRYGKRNAGRTLDGRTWDQYPEPVA
ncbi:phage Gp37/Gp68 family protein [Mycobacteroides chelonae]|uniref:DUF5131 family protein n=1 Tax=Mycobacteroides chelonae TaxID=1774 RepID=UPI003204E19C